MDMKEEINNVINELESKDIKRHSYITEPVGLGDIVEKALNKVGITEERFKKWFDLDECDCTKRKKWLNGFFTYYKENKIDK
jgi:hypothetical protein